MIEKWDSNKRAAAQEFFDGAENTILLLRRAGEVLSTVDGQKSLELQCQEEARRLEGIIHRAAGLRASRKTCPFCGAPKPTEAAFCGPYCRRAYEEAQREGPRMVDDGG